MEYSQADQAAMGAQPMGKMPSIISKMDGDIDAIFTFVEQIRMKLDPILQEPGPDIAGVTPVNPARNALESLALRLPVILSQLRELEERIVL